ncbi:MAG: ATP-binding cassette domain-containing protein, partial [Eubacteriales bacterium]
MSVVEVKKVVKTYTDKIAVDEISFQVESGEIFGLIGPNGAGKSTTIRMIMNIFQPDSGEITIEGQPSSEAVKDRIGYLPEERGLYKKLRVMESIVYLASLKGMEPKKAEAAASELLEQTGMLPQRDKKMEELSKGMSQIIQFIVAVVHDPDLIILDEPFSGLDPSNAELLRSMTTDLRAKGKAIIMSTHQMNEVEKLCDRMMMIDHGKTVLYGSLSEIKSSYSKNTVTLEYEGELGDLPGVTLKDARKGYAELIFNAQLSSGELLSALIARNITVNRFEIAAPSLN